MQTVSVDEQSKREDAEKALKKLGAICIVGDALVEACRELQMQPFELTDIVVGYATRKLEKAK